VTALAAWEALPVGERESMLAALLAQVERAQEAALSGAWAVTACSAKVVVVSAAAMGEGRLLVTWYGHFRLSHRAQSGSDWGEHEVVVKETAFAADRRIGSERTIASQTLHVSERGEDGYDDDRCAKDVALAAIG
jgi:hypothetical protein